MKNLNTLLEDAKAILDDLNIPYGKIHELKTLTGKGTWGRCTYHKWYDNYTISLNVILLNDDVSYESAMDTMIHELLHADKDRMCHTGEWKRCANLVNKNYPQYTIKRCTSAEEKGISNYVQTKAKYVVTCDKCGTKNYYAREGKIVKILKKFPKTSSLRCGKCGGHEFTVKSN